MKPKFLIFGIIAIAALALSLNLKKPFYGYHDWNGITYGQIAKNYLRYGYSTTKLGQVENSEIASPVDFRYDTHYLPGMTLLISLPMHLLGSSEWVIRLLPSIFSLFSLYLIYLIATHLKDKTTGILAASLALATPVFLYFGKNPVHEVFCLTLMLLNIYLYLLFLKKKGQEKNKFFNYLLISSFISLFFGWPAFYLPPALAILGLLKTKQKKFLLLVLLPFIAFLIHLLPLKVLTGSFIGGGLSEIILYRLNLGEAAQKYQYTLLEFLKQYILFSRNMFTPILLLTAVSGLFTIKKHKPLFLVMLITGLAHTLIFHNAGYIHDYLQFPALGFIAISSALFVKKVTPKKYYPFIATLLVLVVFLSKFSFTKAMINSYMAKPEYDLVIQEIKPLKVGESKKLSSKQVKLLRGVVTPYYLEKKVEFNFDESVNFHQVIMEKERILVNPIVGATIKKIEQ